MGEFTHHGADAIEIDEAANKEMEMIIDECKSVLN